MKKKQLEKDKLLLEELDMKRKLKKKQRKNQTNENFRQTISKLHVR